MSIEERKNPFFLPQDPNRYDVLRKDPRCPKDKPGDLNEASAKAFLCLLHSCALVPSPGLSPETRARFVELLTGEVYYKERDRYRTGTENGISLENLDIAEDITGQFVGSLRNNFTCGAKIPLGKLRGKAIILSTEIIRKSARKLPLADRTEYAGLIDQLPEADFQSLFLFKNGLTNVDYSRIRYLKEDTIRWLRKPPEYYFSLRHA